PEAIVERLRTEIFESTGLTASAGIAPNTLLAKVASDQNKPNGNSICNRTVTLSWNLLDGSPFVKSVASET
ncbi:DNA polymerase kappalike, partial [Caligus rogercresseyi]